MAVHAFTSFVLTNFLEASLPFLMRLKLEYLVTKKVYFNSFFSFATHSSTTLISISLFSGLLQEEEKGPKVSPSFTFFKHNFCIDIHPSSSSSTSGIYQCPKSWPASLLRFTCKKMSCFYKLHSCIVVYTFSFE